MVLEAIVLEAGMVDQDTMPAPVGEWEIDANLSAEQIDAIVRAWRGDQAENGVPMSPVGEWDLDGTVSFGKSNVGEVFAACNSEDPSICQSYTYFDTRQHTAACGAGCTNTCTKETIVWLC